jgi:type II secretory pathway component GspD/PulD (secretin)
MFVRFQIYKVMCLRIFIVCLCWTACASAVVGQQLDISRLVHPEVAERLSLTDQQRAQIQTLVLERADAVAQAPDAATKASVRKSFEARVLELLSAEQVAKLSEDQPTQKLSFQFRDMKWEQVLAWFADQQDLTLVMDRIPPGGFTYSDTRTYSPSEGIDLLNSVLMTRGFSLVRREKMLTVMELNDALPIELLPRVTLDQLPQRGRFELVSVVFPLGGRKIEAVLDEVKPYLNSYGRILPLAQGSQVLVIENAGKMQTINELIASIPVPKSVAALAPTQPPAPVLASYSLGGLDAATTLSFMRKLIPSENITVDEKAGILSAFVVPAQQTAIQSAINTLQEKQTELPGLNSVAYKLSGITAADFKLHMATAFPQAKILTTTDQALVMASPAEQEKIKSSLAAMKIMPIQANVETRVLEVSPLVASSVELAIKKFLPDSQVTSNDAAGTIVLRGSPGDLQTASEVIKNWRQSSEKTQLQLHTFDLNRKANAEWLATATKIVPNAKLWLGDSNKQQLLALAEDKDVKALEAILPQLQTLLPESVERKLQIYRVTKQQQSRRSILAKLPTNLSEVAVTETSGGAELLVWATENEHQRFAEFLQLLDQPTPPSVQLVPKSYALQMQDTTSVVTLLTSDFPEAKFTISDDASQLTALADATLHEKIQARVAQFNELLPPKAEKSMKAYQSPGMTAAQLQTALAGTLTKATVHVDTDRARLLVVASETQHGEISKLVALLSEKPTVDAQKIVVVYRLETALASAVKTLLAQLDSEVTIVADDKLKQLAVTGTIAKQTVIQSAIKQIDRPAGVTTGPEVRGYDVKSFQAAQILPTLQALWPDMKMSADTVSNKIIASGNSLELEQFSQAVEKLLSLPAGKQPVVRTYSIPVGDMTTLPTILSQIAPQSTVSSDVTSRTVTVLATEEMQQRVKEAVQQITTTAQSAKRPASYQLKPTQLTAAQTALTTLFPGVTSAIDATTGQIVVVANEQMQQQVASVIELLASGPNSADRSVQVFKLSPEKNDLTSFTTTLQSLIPSQVKVELNAVTGSLIAIGSEEELRQVAKQVEMLESRLPAPSGKISRVYKLQHAAPASALTILQSLVPTATLVQDAASRTIAGTASERDHAKIAEFLQSFDLPTEPKSYAVKPTQLTSVLASLRALFPAIDLSSDTTTGQIIVVATTSVHAQVGKIIDLLSNGPNSDEKTARVFPLSRKWLNSTTFVTTLKTLIPAQVTLESNPTAESIIAIGTTEDLQKVEQHISTLRSQFPIDQEMKSAVYRLKHAAPLTVVTAIQPIVPGAVIAQDAATATLAVSAHPGDHQKIEELVRLLDVPKQDNLTSFYPVTTTDPVTLAKSLQVNYPKALFAGDTMGGGVFVTASLEQHEQIRELIEQANAIPSKLPSLKSFTIRNNSAAAIARGLVDAFGRRTDVGVTVSEPTNSVFVVGSRESLQIAEKIVEQLDSPSQNRTARTLKVFPVESLDGEVAVEAVEAAFESDPRKVDIRYDRYASRIYAFAEPNQLVQIEQVLASLKPEPRDLQVLQLAGLDPYVAKEAIDALFFDTPYRLSPSITVDHDRQQLLIKASAEQQKQVRSLLEQMGNRVASPGGPTNSGQTQTKNGTSGTTQIRFVPVFRNSKRAIDELEKIWPNLRGNPLKILRQDSPKSKEDNQSENTQHIRTRLVGQNVTQDAPQVTTNNTTSLSDPPVVVVVGESQWTLASEDVKALDELERVLELFRSSRVAPFLTTGNYSLYLLQRASASEVQETLEQLLRTDKSTEARRPTSMTDIARRVKIVADTRTNSLIVSGSPNDRQLIEDLLGVLDSDELIGSLQQLLPSSILLKSANATQVETVLKVIYRAQLATSASRKPILIPEGVSADVTSLLQQLNAESASPLLTLTADETTNSIILRAPQELAAEIRRFVESLDSQTASTPSRRVDLIQLKSANTQAIEAALKRLMTK